MPSSFTCMSHFVLDLFFGPKTSTMFTNVTTLAHLFKKKVIIKLKTLIRVKCLTDILMGVCLSVIFSNDRGINKLRK